jgi:uncharacterized RDD family membrane protein YckC
MATTSSPPIRYCSQCGRAASEEELARFGDQMVCGACKPAYAQKLREGVAPQGTGTGYQYGGFWIRVVAQMIDSMILGMVLSAIQYALIFPLTGFSPLAQPAKSGTDLWQALSGMFAFLGISVLVSLAGGSCYEGFFVSRLGATPGKMVFSMKVVRPDGMPLGLGRAFGRYFAKQVNALTLGIGYLIVAFDDQKRGLHDMICDTRVVRPTSVPTLTLP